MTRETDVDVAVIGAGPYGLSVAAHLAALRVPHALFGTTFERWRREFAADFPLRSPVWASSLGAPPLGGGSAIPDFRRHTGSRAARGERVMRDEFVRYGEWFAERHRLTTLGDARVADAGAGATFLLEGARGARVRARVVVVATGLTHGAWLPPCAAALPPAVSTHSTRVTMLAGYAGASVIVVGAGQSGAELVLALASAGASVRWIARRPPNFYDLPMQRSRPLVAAFAALGAAVAMLPPQVRERFREATLRPSVATALRAPIERAMAASHWGVVVAAQANADGVLVTLADGSRIGSERVIWATGHRPSVLHDPVAGALLGVDATDGLPEVSRTGESVRPGVFFVGPWTIGRFGPPVRFLIGTHWQARMVARAAAERARA